jgi:hypothetical protein
MNEWLCIGQDIKPFGFSSLFVLSPASTTQISASHGSLSAQQ